MRRIFCIKTSCHLRNNQTNNIQEDYQLPCQYFVSCLRFTKLSGMTMLASNDFTEAKKVTYSEARPDDHWFKSLMLVHLS